MHRRIRGSSIALTGSLLAIALLVAMCNGGSETFSGIVHYNGKQFAGATTCSECHSGIAESHMSTAHFFASSQADTSTVRGNFEPPNNVFNLNDHVGVELVMRDSGLYQVAIVDGDKKVFKRIDIVIGSGRKGQTYLRWDSSSLFQLPVSHNSAGDQWTNSPGYPTDRLVFDRNVPARCMECHSTFMRVGRAVGGNETFVRDQTILGIGCERCHGPAAGHVAFHRQNPGEKTAREIINPARLSRKQKLDNCALCHSGLRDNFLPSFTYVVGEALDQYSSPVYSADSGATLDVHGNQVGLLAASRCFRNSTMDCSSCHDVHVNESGQLSKFSARCMSCHTPGTDRFCKQPALPGLHLEQNCIDCHMPALPSGRIQIRSSEGQPDIPFTVRTHLIGVYDEQVKQYLEQLP